MSVVVTFQRSGGMLDRLPDGTRGEVAHGPYPFVQLTYQELRVGPEGDVLAFVDLSGDWWIDSDPRLGVGKDPLPFSDVVIAVAP